MAMGGGMGARRNFVGVGKSKKGPPKLKKGPHIVKKAHHKGKYVAEKASTLRKSIKKAPPPPKIIFQ